MYYIYSIIYYVLLEVILTYIIYIVLKIKIYENNNKKYSQNCEDKNHILKVVRTIISLK